MKKKRTNANGGSRNNHEVSQRLSALRADLDALQEDMRGLAGDAAGAATHQVQDVWSGAARSAQQAVARVEDWGNGNIGEVRSAVRRQPLAFCAITAGAGALLGALFLRR